jgi:hypothetical protein
MTDAHDTGRHTHAGDRGGPVRLVLSDAQVEEVLRRVAGDREGGLHELLLTHASRIERLHTTRRENPARAPKLSLSLLRALTILRFLSQHDFEQPLYDIARGVAGTTSTTSRYLRTLKKVGLIEQSKQTRKYRLAATPMSKAPGEPPAVGQHPARITLGDAQIEEVLQSAIQQSRGGLRGFLVGRTGRLEQLGPLRDRDLPDDREISRSLLRALLIVRFLFLGGGVQPLYAIAPGVGLSQSTTHRYLATLKHVRLVEQIDATHEYRLAADGGGDDAAPADAP